MKIQILRILFINTLLFSFVSMSTFAAESKPKKKSLAHRARKHKADFIEKNIPNYLNMQTSLFKDSFETVSSIAKSMLETLNQEENSDPELKSSLEKMSNAKNIEESRSEFKNLSTHFIQWVQNNFISDVEVIVCTQSNSRWIQRKGEAENPFDGAELKKCGTPEK